MNTTSSSSSAAVIETITFDADLVGKLAGFKASQYEAVAATMVVWFDYFLTLEAERRVYWGTKWHWSKVAFACNRYGAMILEILNLQGMLTPRLSHSFCVYYAIFLSTLAGPLQVLFLELIVTARLYAIFGGSKCVLRSLLALLVCTTAASSAIVVYEYSGGDATDNLIPGVSTCFAIGKPLTVLWAYWIPIAIFEVVACCMAVYKTRKYIQDMYAADPQSPLPAGVGAGNKLKGPSLGVGKCRRNRAGEKPRAFGFVETLFMHSLIYFACMAVLVVTGSLILRFESENLMVKQIIAGPIQAILAILGSRLLLNTQNVALETFRDGSGVDTDATRADTRGERREDGIELSDLSETVYAGDSGDGGRNVGWGGVQLDTIAGTILSQDSGMVFSLRSVGEETKTGSDFPHR